MSVREWLCTLVSAMPNDRRHPTLDRRLAGIVVVGLLLSGCGGEAERDAVPPTVGSGNPPPPSPQPPRPIPAPRPTPEAPTDQSVPLPAPAPGAGSGRTEVPWEAFPETAAPEVDAFPAYPWPPEAPSSLVSVSELFDFRAGGNPSLRDVADVLQRALRASGYLERRYFSAPGGYVMVTRLEQTDGQGRPLPDGERYLLPDDAGDFSFADYIRHLFFAPEGYYRFIAFVVTDRAYTTSDAALSEDAALDRLDTGSVALPAEFRELPFTDDHRVDALIYEFRLASSDATVEPLKPGRLPPETHLEQSGLAAALRAAVNPL